MSQPRDYPVDAGTDTRLNAIWKRAYETGTRGTGLRLSRQRCDQRHAFSLNESVRVDETQDRA